jgi:hypothetical protein
VVAHLRHKEQLRSGWTKMHPKSLKDRDDSLCNMAFDTHFENMIKLDYAEFWYPIILERVKSIRLPKKLYNPKMAGGQGKQEEVDINQGAIVEEADMLGEEDVMGEDLEE